MSALSSVLSAAADRARAQSTTDRAVRAAWSWLHTDRAFIGQAFRVWADAEGFRSHPSGLGGVLRRRYTTPDQVAESLARAAREVSGG